jgi:RecJ-like exonuclease
MDWITHEEDVWFEFRGSHPDQLEPGRFYRGTVDGFAEFGVFVDIGDSVTGLLHKSELDTRLESLDWDPGDTVFVQVKNVRDNGNVDLGWSIRQSAEEFRGSRIHDPGADEPVREHDESETDDDSDGDPGPVRTVPSPGGRSGDSSGGTETRSSDAGGASRGAAAGSGAGSGSESGSSGDAGSTAEVAPEDAERAPIETLDDRVGDVVALEGVIADARQTSGPTVFEVRDETGVVECAAFEAAGVRAYPDVEVDDVVRLVGEVERRHGELQVETESLVTLAGDERTAVEDRLEAAVEEQARAPDEPLLADHPPTAAVDAEIREAATAIRKAVMSDHPVVVRHSATADGYAAGVAIERAVLPLVRDQHQSHDAEYHFFERRPLEDGVYDMDSATNDVTDMLEARDRHGEQLPLVVLVDAGATRESAAGYGLLDVYGVDRVVIDGGHPDAEVAGEVDALVNPFLADGREPIPSTPLSANVAARVNPDVRADLRHLPAVAYWSDVPDAYAELAAEAGYDADRLRTVRSAVAFEAYYQSYEDKREIMADLLFGENPSLADHLSDQFDERLETELSTADRNLGAREARGITFAVLDTDAYTHRFDFPPTGLLLDELHRRQRADADRLVTIGVDEDELHVRSTEPLDLSTVGEAAADRAPDAGVTVVGGPDGHLEFLAGERDAVLDAVVAGVAEELN